MYLGNYVTYTKLRQKSHVSLYQAHSYKNNNPTKLGRSPRNLKGNNSSTSFLIYIFTVPVSLYNEVVEGLLLSLRPSVRLAVRLAVRPSGIPYPLCVLGVTILAKLQNLNLWHFYKICNFDYVFVCLGSDVNH